MRSGNTKSNQRQANQKTGNKTTFRHDPSHFSNKATDPHVQIKAWHETCTTIRWAIAGATIVLSTGVVTWGAVAINAAEAPWWKLILFTAAPPLSIVGTAILLLKKQFQNKINELSERNRTLEESIDPTRASSELLIDGTHPHDD